MSSSHGSPNLIVRTDEGILEEAPISLLAGHAPTDRERMPAGNGGLFSTAEDYAKFCRMLLNEGELRWQANSLGRIDEGNANYCDWRFANWIYAGQRLGDWVLRRS